MSDLAARLDGMVAAASPGPWDVGDRNDAGDFYIMPRGSPTWIVLASVLAAEAAGGAEANVRLAALAPALATFAAAALRALELWDEFKSSDWRDFGVADRAYRGTLEALALAEPLREAMETDTLAGAERGE